MFSLPKSLIPPPSLTDVVIPEDTLSDSPTQTKVESVTTPTNPPQVDVPPAPTRRRNSKKNTFENRVDEENTDHNTSEEKSSNMLSVPEEVPETVDSSDTPVGLSVPDNVSEPKDDSEHTQDVVIKEDASTLEQTKTLKELKDLCVARGLPTNVKKYDIAKRLAESTVN